MFFVCFLGRGRGTFVKVHHALNIQLPNTTLNLRDYDDKVLHYELNGDLCCEQIKTLDDFLSDAHELVTHEDDNTKTVSDQWSVRCG
jgi:hypothetical protein